MAEKTKHGPPVGTTFSYTLNLPATVTLTFAHEKSGRKVGTLKGPGKTGKNAVRFTGKIGRHELAPDSYTVAITATTRGSTATKTLTFTIA